MKINVVSIYKNGSKKPDMKTCCTIDENITFADFRKILDQKLGVTAYYQLILDKRNMILPNFSTFKSLNIKHDSLIYRIVRSDETIIEPTIEPTVETVDKYNQNTVLVGNEYVKYVRKEEEKAIKRTQFLRETYNVKDIEEKDIEEPCDLKDVEKQFLNQIKQLRSMGYCDDIVIKNILKLTDGNLEQALYYLSPDS